MPRIAYVNGRYGPIGRPAIAVEDRGYQFGDGVYEVIAVIGGRLIDEPAHFDRLERSLGEIGLAMPMSRAALGVVIGEVVRRGRLGEGVVYLQVTRGAAPRAHVFPARARPVLTVTARPQKLRAVAEDDPGAAVVTLPDLRWRRNDIKSVALLANVLARQHAAAAGATEAWLVDDAGRITEGSATNAWIVTADGTLRTRPTGPPILSGVTRLRLIALAGEAGIAVEERAFSLDEAKAAAEAFLTSTTSGVLAVTTIDGAPVGDGRPGPVTHRLAGLYRQFLLEGGGR